MTERNTNRSTGDDNGTKSSFKYSYSAVEREEIKKIRERYEIKEKAPVSRLDELRLIEKSIVKGATAFAISLGIIACLLMGFGMSIIMTDIGNIFGIGSAWFIGFIFGFLGICGVIAAYPLYNIILNMGRKRAAPKVLSILSELEESSTEINQHDYK